MTGAEIEELVYLAASVVCEYPAGVTRNDLHLRMAISLERARKILQIARKKGLIVTTGSGASARWASPVVAAEITAGLKARRLATFKKCREERPAREAARRLAKLASPQPKPKPTLPHTPNSVWQLAMFV
jgi:hypothetical protein